MGEHVSCPFCHAAVAPLAGARPGQSVTCPRCDETFRVLPSDTSADDVSLRRGDGPVATAPARSNRSIALGVLGLMGLMAAGGLALALLTVKDRRAHDTGLQGRSRKRPQQVDIPGGEPVRAVAPLEMDGLRYLPPDTDLIAAAHVARVLREPAGRKLLRSRPAGLKGSVEEQLNRVVGMTGLRLWDVDHVVIGARVAGRLFPRLQVVVRTRAAYSADEVRSRLKAEESKDREARRRGLYVFRKELAPGYNEGLVSCPDDRTLVLAWSAEPREVPAGPHKDATHLATEMTGIVAERAKPWGPVWAAGHVARWAEAIGAVRGRLGEPGRDLDALLKVAAFAVWLDLEGRSTLHAAVRCESATAAAAVEKVVAGRIEDRKGLKVVRSEEWISLQYRMEE